MRELVEREAQLGVFSKDEWPAGIIGRRRTQLFVQSTTKVFDMSISLITSLCNVGISVGKRSNTVQHQPYLSLSVNDGSHRPPLNVGQSRVVGDPGTDERDLITDAAFQFLCTVRTCRKVEFRQNALPHRSSLLTSEQQQTEDESGK